MSVAPRVVLMGRSAQSYRPLLRESLTTFWGVDSWLPGEPVQALQDVLANAHAVVLGADAHTFAEFGIAPYRIDAHPNIRLLQLAFSNHDWLRPGMLPPGARVCNVQAHAITVAEYVMAVLLESAIGLRHMDAALRAGDWRHSGALFGQPHGELYGKTLGLIGCGSIGAEVAQRASAFGMKVIAVARHARQQPPLAWVGGMERLDELLVTSDCVVVACDLNEGTRGLLDAGRLQRMKSDAFLVSVTRAGVFNEEALYSLLAEKRIGGAALDVWFRYPSSLADAAQNPCPSRFPFHELENLIMTPHAASWTVAHHQRRWRLVATNLDCLARGEMPHGIVFEETES